jgi:hypothetical protein
MGKLAKLVAQAKKSPAPATNSEPVRADVYEHKAKDGSTVKYPGVTFAPGGNKREFFLGLRKLDMWDDHGAAIVEFQSKTGLIVEGCTPERGAFIMEYLAKAIKLALKT